MTHRYMKQLNRTYERQTKLMEQSDGSRLHRGSDDSVAYSRMLRYKKDYDENVQFQSNVKTAISYMKNSSAALSNVSDNTKTLVEKVNAAQGTNTTSDMQAISAEMLVLVQESVSALNMQVGGKFLFSGQASLTQPFVMSSEKVDRAITMTLDPSQASAYNRLVVQEGGTPNTDLEFVTLSSGSSTYFWDTKNSWVISADMSTKYGVPGEPSSDGKYWIPEYISELVDSEGKLREGITQPVKVTVCVGEETDASGNKVYKTEELELDVATQFMVSYYGDTKSYSIPKENGAVQPLSDTANASGLDVMGENVFDNIASGADISACVSALNDMLAIVAKADTGESCANWMSAVGKTMANNAFDTFNGAQTKLAARQQAYESSLTMLESQEEYILNDITDVSSTDVAKLAVNMMELQTTYQLSLSVGSRILPPTLADYL